MTAPERTTARLHLRPIREDDLDAFVALDVELRARADPSREADRAKSAWLLGRFRAVWDSGELGYWTIIHRGQIVGFGGVQPKVWRDRPCWNLYYRLWPEHWGQGLASEMAREAITTAAEVQPQWPVLVETEWENSAAIRLAERVGLVRQPEQPGDPYVALLREPAEAR